MSAPSRRGVVRGLAALAAFPVIGAAPPALAAPLRVGDAATDANMARVLLLFRRLSWHEREAFIRFGERLVAGEDFRRAAYRYGRACGLSPREARDRADAVLARRSGGGAT